MAKVLLIVLRKHKHVLNSEKTLVQQNEAVKPSHIRLHIKIGSMRGVECSTILPMPAFKIFLNSFLGKIAFSSRPILRKLYKIFVWEFQIRENVKFDRSTQPLSAPAPRRCGDGRLQFQSCSLEPVARTRDVGLAAAVASRLVLVGAMMRSSGCDLRVSLLAVVVASRCAATASHDVSPTTTAACSAHSSAPSSGPRPTF